MVTRVCNTKVERMCCAGRRTRVSAGDFVQMLKRKKKKVVYIHILKLSRRSRYLPRAAIISPTEFIPVNLAAFGRGLCDIQAVGGLSLEVVI